MKKYNISAKFITKIDFPIIEAKTKKEAIEKAEPLLLTDKNLEELQDNIPTWEVNQIDR